MDKRIYNFCEQLSSYRYVSFDIFDTLVLRTLSDCQLVYDYVEMLYNIRKNKKLRNFRMQRGLAENQARRNSQSEDVTIDEIYSYLPYNQNERNQIKEIEEECEIKNCIPNVVMIDVLNWCRKQGKYIILATDMYLHRKTLSSILAKCNIKYDSLFISGEERKNKATGNLYRFILKELNVEVGSIIHIGDNILSDVNQARECGIQSIIRLKDDLALPSYSNKISSSGLTQLCRRVVSKLKIHIPLVYSPMQLEQDHVYCMMQNKANNTLDYSSALRIGYGVLGPFLYDFCIWIHEEKQKLGLDKLFFVSREGYLIKKCYEILYPEESENISYAYLNKNILRFPLFVKYKNIESLILTLPTRTSYYWKDIFKYLMIKDIDVVRKRLEKDGFNIDMDAPLEKKDLLDGLNKKILITLLSYQKEVIDNQNNLFENYLTELMGTSTRIGLVNNSMRGSGQKAIEMYLERSNISKSIIGLQFVDTKECKKRLGDRYRAWLTGKDCSRLKTQEFSARCLLLEHLLFKSEGTAVKLREENGRVVCDCENIRKERFNEFFIANIQRYVLEYLNDCKTNLPVVSGNAGFEALYNMLRKPLRMDASLLCGLWDDDAEGDSMITDISLPFRWKYLLRTSGKNIKWMRGYEASVNAPSIFRVLYDMKNNVKTLLIK